MDESVKPTLQEMGFEESLIEEAVKHSTDLQTAIEYIESKQLATEKSNEGLSENGENQFSTAAQSVKCDECGKIFATSEAAQFHGYKSGHSSFSESSEAVKPLTEAEREEHLTYLREKLKEKKARQAEEDAKDQAKNEEIRRKAQKDLSSIKAEMKEKEAKKVQEQMKRERDEEREAKERIRKQIEQDKLERKQRMAGNTVPPSISTASKVAFTSLSSSDSPTTRIQFRFTDSSTLVHQFNSSDTLSDIQLFLNSSGKHYSKIICSYPKKIYEGKDMEKSLKELGLVPSASLMIQ